MAGARCQPQQPLQPPAGHVMKKPVPMKPRITPTALSGQGSSSGPGKRPTSSQRQSQKVEVQRPPTRQIRPNGWRAPRKESSDTGEWRKASNNAEEDGEEDDDNDDDQNEEKSRNWRRRMERKDTSSGREQKRWTGPTKDAAYDQRRRPRSKKDLSSSEDEDENERRSAAALSRDKYQIRRKSPTDQRKLVIPSLDSDDSFDPHRDKTKRPSLGDSGYASSSNSLSSPVELPGTPLLGNSAASLRSAQSLDDELSRRLEGIRLNKDLLKQNADSVNFIQECVLRYLNGHDHQAKWTKCNQGSYYEKVKIQAPNEYDSMLMCEIRCKKHYYPAAGVESKAYCTLKLNATRDGTPHLSHREIHGPMDEDGGTFLSPKKFRNEFEKNLRKALENFQQYKKEYAIEFRRYNGRSPAVTIDVHKAGKGAGKGGVGEFQFSVDFVPAIRLMEWPKPAENWHLLRLPKVEERLKNISPCAVAKIHPSEYTKTPEESRLWRISFSAIEKVLILHADRGLSSTVTCRKNVLRILKMDLVDLKQQLRRNEVRTRTDGDDDDLGFSSFHLKTILLLLTNDREWTTDFFDLSKDDASWSKDRLRQRYVDALKMVVSSLEMEYIQHYFIEGENLLALQEITKRERHHIIDHFQLLCNKYS